MLLKIIIFLKVILISNLLGVLEAANFVNFNDTKSYSYIFAPGLTSTEMQLAKYLPSFIASTGEKISSRQGIHTINLPISICKFAEIDFQNFKNKSKFNIFNPAKYFYYFFNNYLNGKFSVNVKKSKRLKLANTLSSYTILVSKINIGQQEDIKCLSKTYAEHISNYKNTEVILYGASRGAAAAFNFISQFRPKYVKAVILEGIFDSIHDLLFQKVGYFNIVVENLLTLVTSYKKDGISPINNINNIPRNLPILLVTSRVDESVPCQCTINLYNALRSIGRKEVNILILDKSSHVGYICDNIQDKNNYQSVVHAFYRYYGFPHDEELAKRGYSKFKLCKPELKDFDDL